MAFGTGPYGPGTPPASPYSPSLVSSRKIDFKLGRYVITAEGNFDGMPDVHQRAVLLLAFGVREPDLMGPSFEAALHASIREALRPLTDSKPPAAVIRRIEVSTSAGTSYRLIEFTDGSRIEVRH